MRNLLLSFIVAAVGVCGVGAQTLLADSVQDFSGVQGHRNWYYGFYDKTGDTVTPGYSVSDFQQMTQFQGSTWWVNNLDNTSTGYFTRLDAIGGHPNGLDNYAGRLRALREHFAVRRWVSTYSGLAQIEVTIAKRDTGGGTGQSFIFYNNALNAFNPNQPFTTTTPQTFTFTRTLQAGDNLDLFLGWQAQDANGLTLLQMRVLAVPEPGSLIALGLGGALFIRRKFRKS